MADSAVRFLLRNIRELIFYEVDLQTRGEEVVRWIENELEMIIPQLERIESDGGHDRGIEDLTAHIRQVITKAEDLAQTRTKTVIRRNTAIFQKPIYFLQVWSVTKQLFTIKNQIASHSDDLIKLAMTKQPQLYADQSIPSYLRRCIHYFQLFPLNFKVPARRLIALWIAEGLVHSKKYDYESVEKIAERYLNDLIDLKVVQVTRNRSGKVRTCTIDIERRDQLMGNVDPSEAVNFLTGKNDRIYRLVDCNGLIGDSFIKIPAISQPIRKYRDVASFLSFNTAEGSKPGMDIGDFLRKCIAARCFIWLRLLDLERVFRPKLPKSIGKLISLKYLGLRWTYLEQLPDSVNKLFNLQVLDVKHTYISVLPTSIWTMEYLRHLYLSEAYRTRFPDPPSRITLTALQTLWGAFVDENTCIVNGLDTLLNIRKLGLSCRSRASTTDQMCQQLKAIDKWISNLKMLESLRLKSRDENGNAAHLHLTSLEENKNLATVYLMGKMDRLILCGLPLSLTDVTLSGSELDVDPMGFLARLPNLVILRLLAQSVVCNYMCCPRRDFPRLKFLWLWKLENLDKFEAEEGSLPCLEELEIRSCDKLEMLPPRLRRLQNLTIKLTDTLPEFVQKTIESFDKVEVPSSQHLKTIDSREYVVDDGFVSPG